MNRNSEEARRRIQADRATRRISRNLWDQVHKYDGNNPSHRLEVTGSWPGDYEGGTDGEES